MTTIKRNKTNTESGPSTSRQESGTPRKLRVLALGSAVVLTMGLAACSGSSSPSESPSLSAEAQWADSVCTSAKSVETSLNALGSDLSFDPSQGDSAVDQLKTTLKTQASDVNSAIAELGSAVDAVPVDAEGAEQLKTELTNAEKSFQESVQTAADAVQTAADATTTQDFATASAAALVSVKAAEASAKSFATNLSTATSGASSELKAAFDAAPACQTEASPSAS